MRRTAALALLLLATTAAVSPPISASRKTTRTVVFAAGDIAGGFNTLLACCNYTWSGWMGQVEAIRGAFVQDARGDWVKDLVADATATKRSLTYTIRPDAYWYWGGRKVPLTYKDFVYTLRQIDDPHNDISSRLGVANLDPAHFTHVGDRTVTFYWRTSGCPCGPYANWHSLFSLIYPSFALAGLDFNTIWTSCICGSDGKPVSDGPFYLASYTRGQGAVLRANPYFYKRPRLTEIDFRVINEPSLQVEAMRGGQVDAMYPTFTPDLLPLKSTAGVSYEQSPSYALEQLVFRLGEGSSSTLLHAPWMRQAIELAIDRPAMIRATYGRLANGLKPTDDLLFFSNQPGYRHDFPPYDPARALAILKHHCSGGPAAPDPTTSKVWQCAGLPARFGYTWGVDVATFTTIEQLAQADMRAVGIDVVDRPLSLDALFGKDGIASGDFDLTEFFQLTSGDPGDWTDQYRCSARLNLAGYCNHAVDALLTAANSELDGAKRIALFRRADRILAVDTPVVPLFQNPEPLIRKTDLLGLGPNPGGDGPFWNVEDWHWKP